MPTPERYLPCISTAPGCDATFWRSDAEFGAPMLLLVRLAAQLERQMTSGIIRFGEGLAA